MCARNLQWLLLYGLSNLKILTTHIGRQLLYNMHTNIHFSLPSILNSIILFNDFINILNSSPYFQILDIHLYNLMSTLCRCKLLFLYESPDPSYCKLLRKLFFCFKFRSTYFKIWTSRISARYLNVYKNSWKRFYKNKIYSYMRYLYNIGSSVNYNLTI